MPLANTNASIPVIRLTSMWLTFIRTSEGILRAGHEDGRINGKQRTRNIFRVLEIVDSP